MENLLGIMLESDFAGSIANLGSNAVFYEAKRYMDTHFHENISILSVCKHVNLDESYFGRGFKNVFGITPKQYIVNMKMETALACLKEGAPVTDAGRYAGYENVPAFTSAFRKHFRVTPSEYKKLLDSSGENKDL